MVRAKYHLKAGLKVFLESDTGYTLWFTVIDPHTRTDEKGNRYMLVQYGPSFPSSSGDNTAEFAVNVLQRSDTVTPFYGP